MFEAHDKHYELVILNLAKNPIVVDTVTPELAEIAFEALAELPGIVATRHAGIEERKDSS